MKTVEKVARALAYSHYVKRFKAFDSNHVQMNVDANWHTFCDDAVAAISAMRDPEVKMLSAACKAMSPTNRPTDERVSNKQKHRIRFNAMIEAAVPLTKKEKGE